MCGCHGISSVPPKLLSRVVHYHVMVPSAAHAAVRGEDIVRPSGAAWVAATSWHTIAATWTPLRRHPLSGTSISASHCLIALWAEGGAGSTGGSLLLLRLLPETKALAAAAKAAAGACRHGR